MKQRNGFVSNSSSSSFVITYKKTKDNIINVVKNSKSYETEIRAVGIDETINSYCECGDWTDDSDKDVYSTNRIICLYSVYNAIQNEKYDDAARINISYYDDKVNNIFDKKVSEKEIKVLFKLY